MNILYKLKIINKDEKLINNIKNIKRENSLMKFQNFENKDIIVYILKNQL